MFQVNMNPNESIGCNFQEGKIQKREGPMLNLFQGIFTYFPDPVPVPPLSPMSLSLISDSSQLMINPNHSLFLVQALPTLKTWDKHPEMLLLLPHYIWRLLKICF